MAALLWASFVVCAIAGIAVMALAAFWLWTKVFEWYLDIRQLRRAYNAMLWQLARNEWERKGAAEEA